MVDLGVPITGENARSEHLVAMRYLIADIVIMKLRYNELFDLSLFQDYSLEDFSNLIYLLIYLFNILYLIELLGN